MHGASLIFQSFPAHCLCCTPRQGSAGGAAPAGAGQSLPLALSAVPGHFSGDLSEGCVLLCCHREGSLCYLIPGLQSGEQPIFILWQECRKRGGSDWKCYPRVTKGEGKDEANVFYNVFCNVFCFQILFTIPLYTIWSTKESQNQSLQILSEAESFVSYWHYLYCHQLFSSERFIRILCLNPAIYLLSF